jgi:hypothetical protein
VLHTRRRRAAQPNLTARLGARAPAELNASHVFDPGRRHPPRSHAVAGWNTVADAQVLALWLVWRRASAAAEQDLVAETADLLPAVATCIVGNGRAWMPPALVTSTPGTANHRPTCERCRETPVNGVPRHRGSVRGGARYIRTRLHP